MPVALYGLWKTMESLIVDLYAFKKYRHTLLKVMSRVGDGWGPKRQLNRIFSGFLHA